MTYWSVSVLVELIAIHDPLHSNLPATKMGRIMLGVVCRKLKQAIHVTGHAATGRAIAFPRGSPAHGRAPADFADVLDHSTSHVWALVKPSRMNYPGMCEEDIACTATELDRLHLLTHCTIQGDWNREWQPACKIKREQYIIVEWSIVEVCILLTVSKISLTTASERGVATQCSACSEVG